MTELLTLFYVLLFSFIIWKWKWFYDSAVPQYLFVFLFVVKVAAGLFAGELYLKRYEGGDTYAFFKGSQVITNSFYENPADFIYMASGIGDDKLFIQKYGTINAWDNEDVVYNDNRTIIRLNSIFGLFSFQNYYVHVVFFTFISMIGLTGIYKSIRLLTPENPFLYLSAVFLVPGVIFWLSLASKESILIFAMGMLLYHCFRLLTGSKSFVNIAGMFLAGFLFIHIKAYLLVMITPALLAFIWTISTGNKYALLKYAVIYLGFGLIFFNAKHFLNGFDPVEIIYMKRINFENFAAAFPMDMRSYIEIPEFTADPFGFLSAIPGAIYTVLSRPYLWESDSLVITFAAIENVLLIMSVIIGCIYFNLKSIVQNSNMILFCLFFVLSVYALIGLTTPVMGAMVRYKAPLLPFLCLIPVLISGGDRSPFNEPTDKS